MSAPLQNPALDAQAAQAGLIVAMAPDLEAAFARLDVSQLKESLPGYKLLIAAVARRYGLASATLAVRFYQGQRSAAGVTARYAVAPASPPPIGQVGQSVDWATQPLWSAEPDVESAKANVAGAVSNMVLDTGRQTVTDNAKADPAANGWARVPEPGTCAFCALLCIRGDVYRQKHNAEFKSHDNCRCHAEPVFTAYEPSAQIREWESQYYAATRGVHGMKNLQLAWRQAYEGRTPSK
jgi:hypothetical protein